MTPREVILTVGFGCLGITFLIILFSFIGSPYELVERFVEWVKRLRLERATKADKCMNCGTLAREIVRRAGATRIRRKIRQEVVEALRMTIVPRRVRVP